MFDPQRFGRLVLCFLALLSSVACAQEVAPARPAADRPRLVVLLVFDQLRGDYLERWWDLYGDDGFKRLATEGAWYKNCRYPYAGTSTGPGHASILAGCTPSRHGISSNDWVTHDDGRTVNCVNGPESRQVPPPPAGQSPNGATPRRFLAETFADVLKRETAGRGKVVALSMKSRSSVLPAGRSPDACYWFDDRLGAFVTSDHYRGAVHDWVATFNAQRPADAWWGKEWDRFRPELDYAKYSGPDDVAGEALGVKQGKTFPHPLSGGATAIGEKYYEAVYTSPFSNELLWRFARAALEAESLGADDDVDLLSISFSGNDAVGHQWGPDSQEVLDVTLRADRIVAEILHKLDAAVGPGKYLVALTADHGVCPLPEVSAARGLDAGRASMNRVAFDANEALAKKFQPEGTEPKNWIAGAANGWFYLAPGVAQAAGVDLADAQRALADWAVAQREIEAAYTRADLVAGTLPDDERSRAVARSFRPETTGDVLLILKPYWLWDSDARGTTHGTPHDYDQWVPLVFFGHRVKPGVREERVAPLATGPAFSEALGFPAPARAEFPAPSGLWR